jgi:hypothetical protein
MASSFVKKLYNMVEHEDNNIICWVNQGSAFEVLDPKRLEAEVLPKFFRHSRFQSLVRQLNFYAFKKVSKERSSWVYSHDCFVSGCPGLLGRLKRKTNGSALELTTCGGGEGLLEGHSQAEGYDVKDLCCHSPNGSYARKRAYSSASSDFQFCPSDGEDPQDWTEDEHNDLLPRGASSSGHSSLRASEQLNGLKSFSFLPAVTSETNLLAHLPALRRVRSNTNSLGQAGIYSCRKKLRRSYSMGEVDNTSYDTDINFEDILSNWNNVQNFFIDKCKCPNGSSSSSHSSALLKEQEEEDTGTPFSPFMSSFSSEAEEEVGGKDSHLSIELDDPAAAAAVREEDLISGGDLSLLLRFCLEKDPWQRAGRLCADIQDLLAASSALEAEMAAYSAALAPPPHTLVRAVVDARYEQQLQEDEEREEREEREETSSVASSDSECDQQHPVVVSVPQTRAATPQTPRVRMLVQRVPHLSPRSKLTQQVFSDQAPFLLAREMAPTIMSPHKKMKTTCEISTVRTFLAFSLACLHSAAAKEGDGPKHSSLLGCADRWGDYAQCCL